jgi:hypothetical protein
MNVTASPTLPIGKALLWSFFFLAILASSPCGAYKQPYVVWKKDYGGPSTQLTSQMIQSSDNTFVLVGLPMFSKFDSVGNFLWDNPPTYGAKNDSALYGLSVAQVSDQGYILLTRPINYQNYQLMLIKAASNGKILWSKTGSNIHATKIACIPERMAACSDGCLAMTGGVLYDSDHICSFLWKITADGSERLYVPFSARISGVTFYWGYSVLQLPDGGFAIGGNGYDSSGRWEGVFLHTDSIGKPIAVRQYDGPDYDIVKNLIVSANKTLMMTVWRYDDYGWGQQTWVQRTTLDGDTLWRKTYTLAGNQVLVSCLVPLPGGDVLVAGECSGVRADGSQLCLLRINLAGDTVWTFVSQESGPWALTSAVAVSDSEFVLSVDAHTGLSGNAHFFLEKIGLRESPSTVARSNSGLMPAKVRNSTVAFYDVRGRRLPVNPLNLPTSRSGIIIERFIGNGGGYYEHISIVNPFRKHW